jgi:hypothetical protein
MYTPGNFAGSHSRMNRSSVSQPERPEGAGQGQDDPAKVRQPYFLPSFFFLT